MNSLRLAILLFIIALWCACSMPSVAGGGSSQQGNGIIAGTAFNSNGLPAAGATVRVRPYYYVQLLSPTEMEGKIFDAVTDNLGHFVIQGIDPDSFTVEINDLELSAVAIKVAVTQQDTIVDLGNRILQPWAGIAGTLDTTGSGQRRYLVHVRGLERTVLVALDGHFTLANLPEGTFDVQVQPVDLAVPATEVLHVHVNPGATTQVAVLPGWRFMRPIYLNTTQGGAGVSAAVVDFPVSVRLNQKSFDFAQAQSGGRDIRFTKSDGTPLSYEIETWDSAAGEAVLWVRVDTVYGNNETQAITMCWGLRSTGSAAASLSNSEAVFGTAAGFQGVWHLGDQTRTAIDATENHYSGTYAGSLPSRVPGVIGAGQLFGGSGDYADMGNVLNIGSSSFSISAWIKRGNASTVQAIAGKSNGGPPTATYGYSFAFYPADTLNIAVATGGTVFGDTGSFQLKSNIAIVDTASWHHFVAVIDKSNNANCRLFVDGIDRSGSVKGDITTVGALSDTLPFRLGEAANGDFPFAGLMDEVEMAYTARSADWIKLEYMNQKTVDALVEFK
jgi:hypothetical protein